MATVKTDAVHSDSWIKRLELARRCKGAVDLVRESTVETLERRDLRAVGLQLQR